MPGTYIGNASNNSTNRSLAGLFHESSSWLTATRHRLWSPAVSSRSTAPPQVKARRRSPSPVDLLIANCRQHPAGTLPDERSCGAHSWPEPSSVGWVAVLGCCTARLLPPSSPRCSSSFVLARSRALRVGVHPLAVGHPPGSWAKPPGQGGAPGWTNDLGPGALVC